MARYRGPKTKIWYIIIGPTFWYQMKLFGFRFVKIGPKLTLAPVGPTRPPGPPGGGTMDQIWYIAIVYSFLHQMKLIGLHSIKIWVKLSLAPVGRTCPPGPPGGGPRAVIWYIINWPLFWYQMKLFGFCFAKIGVIVTLELVWAYLASRSTWRRPQGLNPVNFQWVLIFTLNGANWPSFHENGSNIWYT